MKNIKIILLSPVVFDKHNNNLVEKIILKLNKGNDNTFFSEKNWELLDTKDEYLSDFSNDLNIKDSILKERNLNPKMYKNLINPVDLEYKTFPLNLDAKLIVNEKHNFLILFEFTFTNLNFNNCNNFIKDIMHNRNLFDETNTKKFYNKVKIKSMNIINDNIKKILNSNLSLISENNFTIDSSYPLILINGFNRNNDLSQLFLNEEDIEQRNTSALITKEYENSFIHIGWNYGIIKDVPKNVSQRYLCMLIFLQLTYYLLRVYKNYFQTKIQTLSNKHTFNEEEVIDFDRLKILYHKEYLGYKTYKSGLFPKYYKEFTNIEILWHMEEDRSFIEKTFEVQKEYINKHFQMEADKTNRKLNYGIIIIGSIQIFAIYTIFSDYVSLKKDTCYPNYLDYATTLIILIITILILVGGRIYMKGKMKK